MEGLFVLISLVVGLAIIATPIATIVLLVRTSRMQRELEALRRSGISLGHPPTLAPAPTETPTPAQAPTYPHPSATAPATPMAPWMKPAQAVPAAQSTHQSASTSGQATSGSASSVPATSYQVAHHSHEPWLTSSRLLAIAGGSLILLGALFFLTMAISNGWISPPVQVALAYAGGVGMLIFGLSRYGKSGGDEVPARVVAGTGVGILLLANVSATQIYDILSPTAGLLATLLVGAAATAIAIRWDAPELAVFGITMGLAAPVIVGAEPENVTLLFMAIALIASVGVVVYRNWSWLLAAALVITVPQLASWAVDFSPATAGAEQLDTAPLAVICMVLMGYWLVVIAGALGLEFRQQHDGLRASSAVISFSAAIAVIGILLLVTDNNAWEEHLAALFIAFAAMHVAVGVGTYAVRASAHVIGILLSVIGFGILGAGIAIQFDGPATVAFWLAQFLILVWVRFSFDDMRAGLAAAGFGMLSLGHVLIIDAPLEVLAYGSDDIAPAMSAVLMIAIASATGAWISHRFGSGPAEGIIVEGEGDTVVEWRVWFTILLYIASGALLYLASIAVVDALTPTSADEFSQSTSQSAQLALSALWGAVGLGALILGLVRRQPAFRRIGLSLLAVTAVKVVVLDTSQLESLYRVIALVGVGVLLLIGAFAYSHIRQEFD